jgi:general secretion pathway protein F
LLARQLQPISLRPQRSWGGRRGGDSFSVLLFAQELHALVQAGLSLIESLEAFAEKERAPQARAVLQRLIGGLREGQRFSAALRAQSTGELASALERYAAYALRLQALRQRVVSAAIYPSILLGVGALVALFLLGYVVPRFAAVYRSGNRTLPWGSQLLLEWGEFAGRHGVWLLVLLVLGAAALAWWARSLARQGDWSRAAARLPGVARWLELLTLSRLFLTLGLLLRGGLPVQPALALVRSVLPPARAAAVDAVSQRVAEGWPLSAALEEARLSTPISLRFVRAGERSGQVADMLHRAALYHDAETARWIERFSRVFEPLLMALIGAVIGVIVLLLYMPIFDLAGSLQ